jgi:hypothetical protein
MATAAAAAVAVRGEAAASAGFSHEDDDAAAAAVGGGAPVVLGGCESARLRPLHFTHVDGRGRRCGCICYQKCYRHIAEGLRRGVC